MYDKKLCTIKQIITKEEVQALIAVFEQAFETTYTTNDDYIDAFLKNTKAIILGSYLDTKLVGGVVAFEMTPLHGTKEVYIYDIAVHPEYQQRGIGSQLIVHLKDEARARGAGTIFVEAERDDEGAVLFYRSLGGEELGVQHFNFPVT